MEDERIMALLERRDEAGLAEAERQFAKPAYALALSVLSDARDAAECVNDAFWALWRQIPPAKPRHLQAYFLKIVRNLALKRLRGNTAQKRQPDALLPLAELAAVLPGGDLADELASRRLLALIERFLRGESAENRALFIRRYWYLDEVDQLAARFALSPSAVESRLFRLRGRLKKFLQREGVEI